MTDEQRGVIINRLGMIADDMRNDAREFDGKPFDGKTVATYFGYHGAAIATLANIIKEVLINPQEETEAENDE